MNAAGVQVAGERGEGDPAVAGAREQTDPPTRNHMRGLAWEREDAQDCGATAAGRAPRT